MSLPDITQLDAWLASREAAVTNIRNGCAKRIVWPDGVVAKAPVSVVYIHGYSASPLEISPVPERVGAALGAPVFSTRLSGHGQDGAAMGAATLPEWEADVAEALSIGAALGDKVLVIGCSTGCTLITLALAKGAKVAGAIMVSPNYGLRSRIVQAILDAPFARTWAPWFTGKTRNIPAINDGHAAYWTLRYPTTALFPMAASVRAVRSLDLSRIKTPCLFATCPDDTVVDPAATAGVAARWGGPTRALSMTMGPGDDANGHVIAGDVFSPGQTDRMIADVLEWWATV